MTIYSRWRPGGGYDYFEAPGSLALGDDLPAPRLESVGGIGMPSIEAGRAIPGNAQYVGSGTQARGLIAPVDPSTIQTLGDTAPACRSNHFVAFAAFSAGAIAAWWFLKWRKHAL